MCRGCSTCTQQVHAEAGTEGLGYAGRSGAVKPPGRRGNVGRKTRRKRAMATINATISTSLDGVIQAPGRSDEDTRDGFDRGGWAVPYGDDVMMQKMGEGMGGTSAMLFGRRTYEDF